MKRLLVLSFIWGWSFLFIKVAVEGMTPATVAGARVALGALVLNLFLRSRGGRMPPDRNLWLHFTVVALVGSALPFTMLAWGEERITSALTAVVNASTPLFTVGFGAMVLRERLRAVQLGGLLLGLGGVAVAAGVGSGDLAGSSIAGALASAAAGACYGLSFAWSKRHLMGIPPLVAATGQLTMATVLMAPFAVGTSVMEGIDLTFNRVGSILLLGLVGTGLAYVLNVRLIADLGPTRASLSTYIIPVVAVVVGVIVLDEQFHLRLLAGGALIVLSVAIVHERLLAPRRVPAAALPVLLVALMLVGCAGDDGEVSAVGSSSTSSSTSTSTSSSVDPTTTTTAAADRSCEAPIEEPLDPSSSVHVLPGAPEPTYQTDPPTSGPHQAIADIDSIRTEPLPRAQQVGVLESGRVLIQYRPDIGAAPRIALTDLAAPEVVIAPNPDLPAAVVATAWLTKLTCDGVDDAALEAFVVAHASLQEGHHG